VSASLKEVLTLWQLVSGFESIPTFGFGVIEVFGTLDSGLNKYLG